MTRPPILTEKQVRVIRENIDRFPADILKLPEFAGTNVTRHTIRNYQSRIKREVEPDDRIALLTALRKYINRYGLESRFHGPRGVIGFITYLEKQINDLRTEEGDDSEIDEE